MSRELHAGTQGSLLARRSGCFSRQSATMSRPGTVYLVGAGPGDPGLCTVRGLELIEAADAVVYDHLVDERLLREARHNAKLVYVGKRAGQHTMSQEEINRLLVDLSGTYRCVVRLKGGDPFVFGRGGEEAIELQSAGVAFEVVPGITSGIAAPAYAGIPLTHRGVATSALLVTGHEDPEKQKQDLDWTAMAPTHCTLAFYMGVHNVDRIARTLIEKGRDAATPAALVRWGTTPAQQTLVARLDEIADRATEEHLAPPAILLVGDVVSFRDTLRWFDNRPLFGKRIVVARSCAMSSAIVPLLSASGAEVIEAPMIEVRTLDSYEELDAAIRRLSEYAWVVLRSKHAVDAFFERLAALELDARHLAGARFAVVGSEIASELSDRGIRADLVSAGRAAKGLLDAFDGNSIILSGKRVLFPCSDLSKPTMHEGLAARGARVDRIIAYQTLATEMPAGFDADTIPDLVTFTSSSAVESFASGMKAAGRKPDLSSIAGASIGPITTKAALDAGIRIVVESDEPSLEALARSVVKYFSKHGAHT